MISFKNKILIVATSVALVIVVGLVMAQWPRKKQDPLQEALQKYRSPGDYTSVDIRRMIEAMKQDPEFQFYFQALDPKRQNVALEKAAVFLLTHRGADEILDRIQTLQEHVDSLSLTFYHLEYPDAYIKKPVDYPVLDELYWQFLSEEFELAVLGVFYKANHDANFIFRWSETARLAAQKLRQVFMARQKFLLGRE